MELSPDNIILVKGKFFSLNATILFTWMIMGLLFFICFFITRRLKVEGKISKRQMVLESIVFYLRKELEQLLGEKKDFFLPFLGTLFLFISVSNLLVSLPFYYAPTSSLSTTAALATLVFFSVPIYGILSQGAIGYLKHYVKPTIFMLPFHIMGELSRTLALAMRLFGNIMSETLLAGVILSIVPLFFPILLDLLGLIIGQVQAYIFSILAAIYIASGLQSSKINL